MEQVEVLVYEAFLSYVEGRSEFDRDLRKVFERVLGNTTNSIKRRAVIVDAP